MAELRDWRETPLARVIGIDLHFILGRDDGKLLQVLAKISAHASVIIICY